MTNLELGSTGHTSTNMDSLLRVFHVGGRGGMGPVECLLNLGKSLSLSIFEANIESEDSSWSDYDSLVADYAKRYDVKLSVIPQCLSNLVGRKEFHINVMPDCSSLLKMSPSAKNYSRMDRGKYRIIWGEICQPTRTIELDVTTLDELYDKHVIQLPHFLSLDVQGAEYDILEGASKALRGDLLGVVSEVEFGELYDGQKLFMDQYALLKKYEFNLFDLYNIEYWYSGPILDKGALMVAEALFLRDFHYFVRKYKEPIPLLHSLSKLAIVAYYFDRRSYAFEIMAYIMNNWLNEWTAFINQNNNVRYLHDLTEFYEKIKAIQSNLEKIPTYSQFVSKGLSSSTISKSSQKLNSVLGLAYNLNIKMIVDKLRRL